MLLTNEFTPIRIWIHVWNIIKCIFCISEDHEDHTLVMHTINLGHLFYMIRNICMYFNPHPRLFFHWFVGRVEERERQREISMWEKHIDCLLPALAPPSQGMCPWLKSNQGPFHWAKQARADWKKKFLSLLNCWSILILFLMELYLCPISSIHALNYTSALLLTQEEK